VPTTIKYYGNITEITTVEKKTRKRSFFLRTRKRSAIIPVRRPDNLRRTKQLCMRRVSCALADLGVPLFVTLTFKGSASNVWYASRALSAFQRRLRAKYPLVHSVFVPELSPRGRLHFHGLLFGVPLHFGDVKVGRRVISYGTERRDRTLAKLWREGHLDALQTDGSYRLAGYISKYITKGAEHPLFAGIRIMRVSQGFPREIVVRDEYFTEKILPKFTNRKPVSYWEHDSIFLGKITKTRYDNSVETIIEKLNDTTT